MSQQGRHSTGERPRSPLRPKPCSEMSIWQLIARKEELARLMIYVQNRYRKVAAELDSRGDTAAATHGDNSGDVSELPQYLRQAGPKSMFELRTFGDAGWAASEWYCLECQKWADPQHVVSATHLSKAASLSQAGAGFVAAAEHTAVPTVPTAPTVPTVPTVPLPAQAARPGFAPTAGVAGASTARRTGSTPPRSRSRHGQHRQNRQHGQHPQRRSDSRDSRDSRRHGDSGRRQDSAHRYSDPRPDSRRGHDHGHGDSRPRPDSRRSRDSRDGYRRDRHTSDQAGRVGVWK